MRKFRENSGGASEERLPTPARFARCALLFRPAPSRVQHDAVQLLFDDNFCNIFQRALVQIRRDFEEDRNGVSSVARVHAPARRHRALLYPANRAAFLCLGCLRSRYAKSTFDPQCNNALVKSAARSSLVLFAPRFNPRSNLPGRLARRLRSLPSRHC